MEFKKIKELISLVNSTDITDLEIEDEEFRLRICKEKQETNFVQAPNIDAVKTSERASVQIPPQDEERQLREDLIEVTAPMVGTFYRAPAPDEAPYVQVGEKVSPNQTLFIIEAMKMMNEIESEVQGIVKEILVENGEPVEYGQPLLLIDPKI